MSSTAHMFGSRFIRAIPPIAQPSADLIYSATGIASMLHALSGMTSTALHLLPGYSMVLAGIEILSALDESYSLPRGSTTKDKAEVHVKTLVRVATNGALGIFGYETLHQTMSWGSPAFGFLCDGLAIKAAGDWAISLYDFIQARKEYQRASIALKPGKQIHDDVMKEYYEARSKLIFNTLNFLGWGLLALSKVTALSAATPYLLFIGTIFLGGAALYKGMNFVSDFSVAYTKNKESFGTVSLCNIFLSLFPKHAHGAGPNDQPKQPRDKQDLIQNKRQIQV